MWYTSFSFLPEMNIFSELRIEDLERHQDRVLYGSDFPNLIFPYDMEIHEIRKLELSDAVKKKFLYDNGHRLLRETCPEAFSVLL